MPITSTLAHQSFRNFVQSITTVSLGPLENNLWGDLSWRSVLEGNPILQQTHDLNSLKGCQSIQWRKNPWHLQPLFHLVLKKHSSLCTRNVCFDSHALNNNNSFILNYTEIGDVHWGLLNIMVAYTNNITTLKTANHIDSYTQNGFDKNKATYRVGLYK